MADTPTAAPTSSLTQLIESDSSPVQQVGAWTVQTAKLASDGTYIYSSGSLSDGLVLAFEGSSLDIVYIKHPALGSFAVDVDGQRLLTVNATASSSLFGEHAEIRNLPPGVHIAQIVVLSGTIAIDAFRVEALASTTEKLTSLPTVTPDGGQTAETLVPTPAIEPSVPTTLATISTETVTSDELSATAASMADISSVSRLIGQINTLVPSTPVTLTLVGNGLSKTMVLQRDGTFSLALVPGNYQLTITARYYLPYTKYIQLTDQPATPLVVNLVAGDVNEDGIIDVLDAQLIAANFGLSVPPASVTADVNGDHMVNIYDLVIVSTNMKANK